MKSNLGIGGHQSHHMLKDEWLTPQYIIDALGPFDLDPCAPVTRLWDTADRYYTIEDDGLSQEWEGLVWLNPPYGKQSKQWLTKLRGHPDGGIALIFARTETEMFVSEIWDEATALLFLYGRIYFYHVDGTRANSNSGAPSLLIAYGAQAMDRLNHCRLPGAFISNWRSVH